MNHTERINYTARKSRQLTRRLVKETVEIYLEKLGDEIAAGEWVDLPGIGKMQVIVEKGSRALVPNRETGKPDPRKLGVRLRTRIRLFRGFKRRCYPRE